MKNATAYPRLRAYTLWTLPALAVLMALGTLVPVLHPASRWLPVTGVFVGAMFVATLTASLLSWQLAARKVEGGARPTVPIVAHCVIAGVALCLAVVGDPVGFGRGSEIELVPSLFTGLVGVLALLPFATVANARGILAMALGVAGAALITVALQGELRGSIMVPVALPVLAVAGGLFFSVRISIWYLEQTRRELDSAQLRAELAVAEERLRFSRDLHDIFGRTLTAVAVKSDLAAELADHGRAEAASAEMRAVHALSQEALAEVRQVVAGYRTPELATELRGARALLESSGIEVRIVGEAGEDPPEVFGWVVREAVTNILRHAKARHCDVRVSPSSVQIANDGAPAGAAVAVGAGLTGLRDRLAAAGGTLEVTHEEGTFTVRASVGNEP